MNICIEISSLVNRGDWLMFEAILEQVRMRLPSARVSVPTKAYSSGQEYFKRKGVVEQVDDLTLKDLLRRFVWSLLRKDVSFLKVMPARTVDVLFFSPGFRFSDQFKKEVNEARVSREVGHFRRFTKNGCKIFFLPQAFGPFEELLSRRRIELLSQYATHIYAREPQSYSHVREIVTDPRRLSIAPDFTCLYCDKVKYPLPFSDGNYVVVIPNKKMITSTGAASKYCDFMIGAVRKLSQSGEQVVFLNHQGPGDDGLIDVLNASIDNHGLVIRNVSGGACKSIISRAKFVITSRFHGLVSAMTSAVPVICTCWSHKYKELVSELGSPRSCVDVDDIEKALAVVSSIMADPGAYRASIAKIDDFKASIHAMWDDIFAQVR